MGKVFFILLLCLQLFSIIEACPRCKTVEAKSVCLGSEVAVRFEATWDLSQGDCPHNGGAQYQLMKDNVLMPETVADFFNPIHIASHFVSVAGKWKVRVRLNGTCANGFSGYGPWSDYANFNVVELQVEGYTFCNAKGSQSTSKDFATCLNENGTIKPSIKIIPDEYKFKAEKIVAGNDEESDATVASSNDSSLSAGTITMGEKSGTIEVKFLVDADFVSCSSDASTSKCCGTAKGVFFIPDKLRITNECDQLYVDVDNKEAAKLEMAVVLKGAFEDNGFIPTNSKAGKKAKITFTKTTKPIGYQDQLKIEGLDADEYEFTKSEAKTFILKCICAGSVQVSAKVHAYQIEITSPGDKLVKDNPIHAKGFEVEAPDNEPASRGDANGNEFIDEDQANFKVEVIEGPDTDYDLHIEIIDGNQFADLVLEAGNSTNDVDVSGESVMKLKLRGEKFSEDSKDVHVEVTLKHHSEVPTSKCSVGVAKTVVETDTWEPPIVYNPRPFVTISNVTFADGALLVTGTVQDWTCTSVGDFLRKNVNLTEASQTALTTGLDISKTQPLSATWSATVPIREGSGNTFVVTAAFQNRLRNFGIATATVNLTQNAQGKIIAASIGVENNSKPSAFEIIETFTIVSYDADGDTKPSVPWKLRAFSGHEKEIETDETKTSKPTFVSKSYAVMLDNFFENKSPEFVLRAKPGDRLINLLECGTLNASEYTYSKGLYLGGSQPIESVNLNPGANNSISATLGGDFGDASIVDFISENASSLEIGFDFLWFIRQSDNELAINYRKYNIEEDVYLYLWDGKNHDDIKAEGGGELKAEIDDLTSVEPTLHIEIVTPKLKLKEDPAIGNGPFNINWSEIRDEFYDGPFKSNIDKLNSPLEDLVGVAVTDVLPVLEIDTNLKPNDIIITEKIVDGKKRYLGTFLLEGVVRDVLANINLEAKINYVSASNWNDDINEMEKLNINLIIKNEKISPAKPLGHTSTFNQQVKYELIHGENYIRVVSGRNALGASTDAFYLIKATEKIIDTDLETKKLIIDKVTTFNIEDPTIKWSPYFANIRNGLLYEDSIPEKINVGNASMENDHLYDFVIDGINFKANKFNNWSSKVFVLLPFSAKKPNTEYDLPLNGEINPDFGFISNEGSAPFSISANDLESNKAEVFSVDLSIKDLKPEDEADKGFYIRKSENVSEPKSDCQPVYPVMIDLKTSAVVKKLVENNKGKLKNNGELKLEVIKSKRTPDVSLSIKLADGQKTVDGSLTITDANQQIEVLGLENGVAELKLSFTYNDFYTQDIIRLNIGEINFIEPYSDSPLIPIKVFQPKAFFSNVFIKTIPKKNIAIISGTIEDWSGDVDLNSLFCNGALVNGGSIELLSLLNIHGTTQNEAPIAGKGFFQFNFNLPNSLVRDFNISLVYRNKVGFYSEYNTQVLLNRDNNGFVSAVNRLSDYSYPNSLEDIRPYLFRVYLFDASSESSEKVNVEYQIKDLSGTKEVLLEPNPSLSPKHYSRRKVMIPDGTRGNFNINEINEDILIGWPGSKPTVKYQLKTNQTVENKNVAVGLVCVDSTQSKPVFSVISNSNRNLEEGVFRNNYFIVGGFFSQKCFAPEFVESKTQALTDFLEVLEKPDLRYLDSQKEFQLNRKNVSVEAEDYFYYNVEPEYGFMATHMKGTALDPRIIPIYTHGGFQKFTAKEFEISVKVIRSDIFINDGDKNNNSIYSVPEYISNSDNKPKLTVNALIKNREISNDENGLVQSFNIRGQVEDEYAEITNTLDGQIRYISIADNVISVKNIANPKAISENRPFPFLGAFNGEFKLKLIEGENIFFIRTGENIFQHDDIIPLTINTIKKNNKLTIVNFNVEPVEIEANQKRFILGLTGGVQLFDNKNKSMIVNEESINLFHENRQVIKNFLPPYVYDTYSNGVNIFTAYSAIKTKVKPDDAQAPFKFSSIIKTIKNRFEINHFNEDKTPYHYADIAILDIIGKTVEGKVVVNEHEISSGLNSPLFDKNKDKKLQAKAPSFKIQFNQQLEFVNPKAKFELTLFGKNDISIFMNDKEILNQNVKTYELKGGDFNNEFFVYGYNYGINYLKAEFLLNNKSVTYDLVRLVTGSKGFVDIDVDSDNNDYFLPPDRTIAEDEMEAKKNNPGKYVNVNGDDEDGDSVPDFADGFNLDGVVGNADDISIGDRFIPLVIEIPVDIKLQDIKLTLTYEHSGKILVKRRGEGTRDDPFGFSKEKDSTLRIWSKDGNQKRNINEINKNDKGDFIPSKTYEDVTLLGFKNNKRIITLYMEGLAEKHPDGETIKVQITFANGDYYDDEVKVLVYDLNLGVDGDRDGVINFSDPIDQNIDFWVNNDIDANYRNTFEPDVFDVTYAEDDLNMNSFFLQNLPLFEKIDCQDDWIGKTIRFDDIWLVYKVVNGCLRDLEDVAKLKLGTINKHLLADNTEFYIRIKKPNKPQLSIGIFNSFNENLNYVVDLDEGEKQIKEKKIVSVNSSLKTIDKNTLNSQKDVHYLFEGEHEGKGYLVFGAKLNGIIICEKGIPIELRDIKTFYPHYRVDPKNYSLIDQKNKSFHNKSKTAPMIVYVHGWNMGGIDARWAETMFKRLYWQGYKGHVCLFDWDDLDWNEYDDSEENAWNSADALRRVMNDIRLSGHQGEISILGHSQGNIVVGEYLRNYANSINVSVKAYIATQSAISAHFYDNNKKLDFFTNYETPNIYGHYTDGIGGHPYMFENISKTKIYNLYNEIDFALDWWKKTNILRPNNQKGYHYSEGDSNPDTYYPDLDDAFMQNFTKLSLSIQKERYKIFAQCSESRSLTLGATIDDMNGFTGKYDLHGNVGYTGQHYSHSREFRSNIIDEKLFWEKVLKIVTEE